MANGSQHFFSSESVTEGHPDKVADCVSDTILDAFIAKDPEALVACETLVTTDFVVLAGEIHTTKPVRLDFSELVRGAIRNIGYNSSKEGFNADTCEIVNRLHAQSDDIRQGVIQQDSEIGAGDQGLMFGFACDETTELMPLPISLAHAITAKLTERRKSGAIPWLRPDGKSQVTIEYRDGKPYRVDTIVVSTQHAESVSQEEIHAQVESEILNKVIKPEHRKGAAPKLHINPTGRFVTGGPHGDCGLTGRKIIVDTYGGYAPHGGGAFSGKDPTKVDRAAAYMARYIAKNLVAAGLATKMQVQLAYAIGVADPVSILLEDFGTSKVDLQRLEKVVRELFPMKPREIIRHLDLRKPIYARTTAYGHFGRENAGFTWEKTDKVAELKRSFA
ncbi:MAG: methionine adenosyltransferase [Bdellovibrionales bacterium]|nr:methionine adenosyltransferase [Bdellovibrionales bacterium]